jgi:hypothetical protein
MVDLFLNHLDVLLYLMLVCLALSLLGAVAKLVLLLLTLPARMRGELFCRNCGRMFTNKAARFCGSCGTGLARAA